MGVHMKDDIIEYQGQAYPLHPFTHDEFFIALLAEKVFAPIYHNKDIEDDCINIMMVLRGIIDNGESHSAMLSESSSINAGQLFIHMQAIASGIIANEWFLQLKNYTTYDKNKEVYIPKEQSDFSTMVRSVLNKVKLDAYKSDRITRNNYIADRYAVIIHAMQKQASRDRYITLSDKYLLECVGDTPLQDGITEKTFLEAYIYGKDNQYTGYKNSYEIVAEKSTKDIMDYIGDSLRYASITRKGTFDILCCSTIMEVFLTDSQDRTTEQNDIVKKLSDKIASLFQEKAILIKQGRMPDKTSKIKAIDEEIEKNRGTIVLAVMKSNVSICEQMIQKKRQSLLKEVEDNMLLESSIQEKSEYVDSIISYALMVAGSAGIALGISFVSGLIPTLGIVVSGLLVIGSGVIIHSNLPKQQTGGISHTKIVPENSNELVATGNTHSAPIGHNKQPTVKEGRTDSPTTP